MLKQDLHSNWLEQRMRVFGTNRRAQKTKNQQLFSKVNQHRSEVKIVRQPVKAEKTAYVRSF